MRLSVFSRSVAGLSRLIQKPCKQNIIHYKGKDPARASNEKDLQRFLLNSPPEPFSKLEAHEWFVEDGKSHLGVGDLVFKNPQTNSFVVIETKYIKKNPSKRFKKVTEQAHYYAKMWKARHPEATVYFAYFTNVSGLVKVGKHA